MSLSPEEESLLERLCGPANIPQQARREAVWIAAKNYWLEQAAKACVDLPAPDFDEYGNGKEVAYGECVEAIRALKDKHG